MANYDQPTVIQPTIPAAAMTPLERLLLTRIFDSEPDGEGLYFFAEESPTDMIWVDLADLRAARAASEFAESTANAYVAERLAKYSLDAGEVELDLSGTSWTFFLQDIVRRSPTLDNVTAVTSFTCSKMRPDGFGGMVVLIAADAIKGKSTEDILCELLDEHENGELLAAPGFGVHTVLSLDERRVRAAIPSIIETDETLTGLADDAVTAEDIRAGCCAAIAQTDLSEEQGSTVFHAALAAIHLAQQRHITGNGSEP